MSDNSSSRIIRFSTFEVNFQTGELRQRGQKVRLQEQPLQVLAALLERPGELVTREELRSKLWPADTFVDFDHGLNAAVKRLRDVLGESADAPIFTETLARRGYRFVAPVSGSSVPRGIEIASASKRGKLFFLTRWVAALCLALILVAVVAWAPWRLASRRADIVERRLTSNSSENWVSGASISPDGKNLAYSDNTGIYLKLIRTGETHSLQLPANFFAHIDDWFPDGSHLLMSHEDEPRKTSLWSISVFGGSPRHLADDAAGGSVSPDGSHVAFLRSDLTWDRYGRDIWIMRSDGTDAVKVAGIVTGESDDSRFGVPTWSSDGKRIAYIRARWSAANDVEVNEWQSGRAETIFSDSRLVSVLHWLRDGRLVYALSDQESWHDTSLWAASLLFPLLCGAL
jgi:DNA-binding winged helix-turn-helix (wHTH) protein